LVAAKAVSCGCCMHGGNSGEDWGLYRPRFLGHRIEAYAA
jgi:hypothetical protein